MITKKQLRFIFCAITMLCGLDIAQARAMIGLGGAFTQDSNSLSDQSAISNSAYNVTAYASLSRGVNVVYLGVEVMATNIHQSLDANTKAILTSTDYMLSLKYTFADELFALTAGFSPYTQANYKLTALNKDTWFGTSYMTKISVQPDLGITSTKFKVGASILYYHSAYTKKTDSETTNSSGAKQSFERSFMAPSLELIYKF